MVTPRKSPVDPNSYRFITLPNGFKALLISTCGVSSEPPEKKRAYTKKSKRCAEGPKKSISCEDKTKLFNRRTILPANTAARASVDSGASLLQNIAVLAESRLNPFHVDPDDVPVEDLDEEAQDFPELSAKQEALACKEARKYDMLACMALCIGSGYFEDPPTLKGAAHLLEHIFLMGCEKYKDESYLDEFLEFTGGSPWNGNTDGCRTVFFFDTSADFIAESLDILAEHIKRPLLSMTSIVQERETIDAEWRKAIPVETFRFNQLLQSLSMPTHPYHTFSWGNAQSLGAKKCDAETRRTVVRFFREHYSPNNMFFAIQAPDTLRKLEELVTDAFGCLPENKNLRKCDLTKYAMPFCNKRFAKLYKVAAVSNTRKLMVTWQLPAIAWKEYDVKPLNYIGYVLMDQNRSGLVHYLVQRGLITDLTVNPTESNMERSDACAIFSLHFTLTEHGLKSYQEILLALFSYIRRMVSEGPQYRIFQELTKIYAMQFHYLRESDQGLRVKELSEALRIYRPEDVISGPVLVRKYDPDLIARLTGMLRPDEANFMLFSKDFKKFCNQREQYFGVEYKELSFPCECMKALKSVDVYSNFGFCVPNPFITDNFCLVQPHSKDDVESLFPIRISDSIYSDDQLPLDAWFFQDDNLLIPQANYLVTLNSSAATDTALNAVMLDIYAVLIRDHFRGPSFSATSALLQVDIQTHSKGLQLSLAGFSQKLPFLLEQLLETIAALDPPEDRFQHARFVVAEEYENFLLEPCSVSADLRRWILYERHWPVPVKYAICNCETQCTPERFKKFVSRFKSELHVRAYLGGNLNRNCARQIMSLFPKILRYEPLSFQAFPKSRANLFPIGEKCVRIRSFNTEGDTTAVKNVYQIGPFDYKLKIICDYILETIAEPLFHVLRTEKGLSYNPDIIMHEDLGVLTLQIHLPCRANKHEPHIINKEVDDFLQSFYELHVSTLTEAKIQSLRKEMVTSKLDHVSSPGDCEDVWEDVIEKDIDFHFMLHEIEEWKCLTAQDIKDFFKKYLLKPSYVARRYPKFLCHDGDNLHYRKISIQVVGYKSRERQKFKSAPKPFSRLEFLREDVNEAKCDEDYFIDNVEDFKKTLLSFPPQF